MYRHNVSALAIVDDTNAIVANVSVSDLRGIKPDDFDQLASPVVDYLRRRRRGGGGGSQTLRCVLYTGPHTTALAW